MIKYKCANCGATLESPSSMAGQEDKCPLCGHLCTVPESKGQTPLVLGICGGSAALVVLVVAIVWLWPRGNESAGTPGEQLSRAPSAADPKPKVQPKPKPKVQPKPKPKVQPKPSTKTVTQPAPVRGPELSSSDILKWEIVKIERSNICPSSGGRILLGGGNPYLWVYVRLLPGFDLRNQTDFQVVWNKKAYGSLQASLPYKEDKDTIILIFGQCNWSDLAGTYMRGPGGERPLPKPKPKVQPKPATKPATHPKVTEPPAIKTQPAPTTKAAKPPTPKVRGPATKPGFPTYGWRCLALEIGNSIAPIAITDGYFVRAKIEFDPTQPKLAGIKKDSWETRDAAAKHDKDQPHVWSFSKAGKNVAYLTLLCDGSYDRVSGVSIRLRGKNDWVPLRDIPPKPTTRPGVRTESTRKSTMNQPHARTRPSQTDEAKRPGYRVVQGRLWVGERKGVTAGWAIVTVEFAKMPQSSKYTPKNFQITGGRTVPYDLEFLKSGEDASTANLWIILLPGPAQSNPNALKLRLKGTKQWLSLKLKN